MLSWLEGTSTYLPYPTEVVATAIEIRSVGRKECDLSIQSTCPTFLVVDNVQFVARLAAKTYVLARFRPGTTGRPHRNLSDSDRFYRVRLTAPHGCHVVDQLLPGRCSASTLGYVRPTVSHTTTNHNLCPRHVLLDTYDHRIFEQRQNMELVAHDYTSR
jgi:hypothetical protein